MGAVGHPVLVDLTQVVDHEAALCRGVVNQNRRLPNEYTVRVEAIDGDGYRQGRVRSSAFLATPAAQHPGLRKVWVGGGYRKHFVEHAATLGIDLEIVQRKPGAKGFPPSRNAGQSNGPTAGSCFTAAWPATTKPTPTAPKRFTSP